MNDTEVLIREAKPGDIDRLAGFLSELFSIEDDFCIDPETQKRGLRLLMENPERSVLFVAVIDHVPVGMVTGQIVISTAAGGNSVLLEDMFVTGSYRGMGIGTALFRAVVSWGESHGAERVQLLYDTRNLKAKSFYVTKGMSAGNMSGMYGLIRNL